MADELIDITPKPQSDDGFYATNNQFQVSGPKGFTEFKHLENKDLYCRCDMPGVPNNGFKYVLDEVRKGVIVTAVAPKENKHDNGVRRYIVATGLTCDCCEIASVKPYMQDGVMRMILRKRKLNLSGNGEPEINGDHDHSGIPVVPFKVGPYPRPEVSSDWSGHVIKCNPSVYEGSRWAIESKKLQNGGLYLRIDLPGATKDNVTVSCKHGEIQFQGSTKRILHDVSARTYLGCLGLKSDSKKIGRKMKSFVKNGVLRLTIPPPS